jgi:hypothetical protein
MSNLVNMNRRTLITEAPLFSWKGKSFPQISSIIKRNNRAVVSSSTANNRLIFLPNPLKIYRREIAANMDMSGCHSSRSSVKIDELDRPNGSLVYNPATSSVPKTIGGVTNYIDLKLPTNKSELPGTLASCVKTTNTVGPYAFSQTQNALRRVRSSGNVRKQYSPISNKPIYYTDSTQYLISRNKTFQQNQFNYFESGNQITTPGTAPAQANTYYANGTSTCGKVAPVYYKPNNPQFSQQGAVSSSSLTTRLKYDTVTNNAYLYKKSPLGSSVANALSYGVSEQGYTSKDKIGYPNKKTPVIDKYTGRIKKCSFTKISHQI